MYKFLEERTEARQIKQSLTFGDCPHSWTCPLPRFSLFLKESQFSFLSPPLVCFPSISFLYKYWMSPLGVSPATCACSGGLFLLESLPVTVIHYYRKNCTNKLRFFFCCKKSCFVHSYWEHLLPLLQSWEFGAWILLLPPECPVMSAVAKQNFSFSQLPCTLSLWPNFSTTSPPLCYLSNWIGLCIWKNSGLCEAIAVTDCCYGLC